MTQPTANSQQPADIRNSDVIFPALNDSGTLWTPQRDQEIIWASYHITDAKVQSALVDVMIYGPDGEARQAAFLALSGSSNPEVRELRQAVMLLSNFVHKIGENLKDDAGLDLLKNELIQRRDCPLVAEKLVEYCHTRNPQLAFHAATVLQGTSRNLTIDALKDVLQKALTNPAPRGRDNFSAVLLALKGSKDPEAQQLIIEAFKAEDPRSETRNFTSEAARSLGAINTPDVHELLVTSVTASGQYWNVRSGVAEAIRELNSSEIHKRLLPLVQRSASQTAWKIADERSSGPLEQAATYTSLMLSAAGREEIHKIRVQVGLALEGQYPELAARVFNDALKGQREPFNSRCGFSAACHALRSLEKMEG